MFLLIRLTLRIEAPLVGTVNWAAVWVTLGLFALLFLVAASGLGLWWARGSNAMTLLLCLHLGAVMALFATLPYGKFAHGVFRSAALLRYAVEKRQPNPIGLGAD